MSFRHVRTGIATGTLAVMLAGVSAGPSLAQSEINWWHAMTDANNDVIVKLAEDFNAS